MAELGAFNLGNKVGKRLGHQIDCELSSHGERIALITGGILECVEVASLGPGRTEVILRLGEPMEVVMGRTEERQCQSH